MTLLAVLASRGGAFTTSVASSALCAARTSRATCLRVRGGRGSAACAAAEMAADGPLEGGNGALARAPHSATQRATCTRILSARFLSDLLWDANHCHAVLYCKRGPEAGMMGDCPFTQKAHMALRAKGFEPQLALIDLANKPAWFLDLNKAGSAPVFVTVSREVLTESDDIVAFADKQGSGPQLQGRAGGDELWATAKAVFPAFAAVMKNKEENKEDTLLEELKSKLADLDQAIGDGPLLLGEDMSEQDCRLAPFLFHINSALPHYKKVDLLPEYPKVAKYFQAVSATPAFQKTACPPETVVWGWSAKVGIAH